MIDDQDIITKIIKNRDSDSYAQLIRKYQSSVFTFCLRILKNREEAEEVAQDVFIKCFKELNKLKDYAKFKGWVMRIAYTTSIDRKRIKQMNKTSIDSSHEELLIEHYSPYDATNIVNRKEILKFCIDKLDKDQGIIINLYYLEDLSINEISEITGMTNSNIKVKLFRARNNLRSIISPTLKRELKE